MPSGWSRAAAGTRRAAWGADAPVLPVLVSWWASRLRRAENANQAKSSVRYDFYHLYHFHFSIFMYSYYSAYFIFFHLKVKSENSINGRNTLNPLRHNGFGYTIFKSRNSMKSCQNVGKRWYASVAGEFSLRLFWYEK